MEKPFTIGTQCAFNYKNELKLKNMGEEQFYSSLHSYAGHTVLNTSDVNIYIKTKIEEGKPFFAGRLGAVELSCASMFEFDIKCKKDKAIKQLATNAGFFPPNVQYGNRFNNTIIDSTRNLDLIGIWNQRFEDYYLRKYANKDLKVTYLLDLEPWRNPEKPWTEALEGKKVLVIHPFEGSIKKQYARRLEIFPKGNILPNFNLITFKAVQTIAGVNDDRFQNWFEALDWMYDEITKIDFDIAIIGCGAYGFPLASKIKQFGKQAIHLGGATQLLFGIKGRRWIENEAFGYVKKMMNDSWIYPSESEKPKNAKNVENGCYW